MLTTPTVSLYPIVILTALAILAGFLQIRLRGLGTQISVRFFVLLISMAIVSGAETAAIAFVSALVEVALRPKPRPGWAETLGYAAISMLAAYAAYRLYHVDPSGAGVPPPLLMVLAAIVYFVVSSVVLAKFNFQTWRKSYFWTFPHYVAGGSAAALLTISDRHNGWQICVLTVPLLYWMVHAYKAYLGRIEQERRGAEA